MRFSLLLFVLICLSNCGGDNESYYDYVEIRKQLDSNDELIEQEPETIWAVNDSIAYIEALKKFYTSLTVHEKRESTLPVPKTFKLFNIDSIDIVPIINFQNKDSVELTIRWEYYLKQKAVIKAEKAEADSLLRAKINREISSLNEGFDNSSYDKKVESIQMGIALFGLWAKIVEEGEASDKKDINKLAQQLKRKVQNLQIKQYPILRKRYAKVVKNKLWDEDIQVSIGGRGNTVLNFTGGVFAANKNKKEFNNQIYDVLKMFRFKQTRYRWYKGQDEYTYWDFEFPNDKDLVVF